MIPIIDAHAHLADPRQNLAETLKRARANGVVAILSNGTRPDDWNATLDAARHECVFAALGVHPFYANEWNDEARTTLIRHIEKKEITAIGEIGLDNFPEYAQTMEIQLRAFREQLQLAQEYTLPVCLHLRKAWEPFFIIIKELGISRLSGYCHNFTGSVETANALVALGLHISFGTTIANQNAKRAREAARQLPPERLLTETDCPDMAPSPEHAATPLQTLAEIKAMPIETLAATIEQNFNAIFK